MAEPLRERHRSKLHRFHRSHKMKRQRHGSRNELDPMRLARQTLRGLSGSQTTPLSHYSIHTEPGYHSAHQEHQDYHSVANTFPGDSSSSSFSSMTEPIHSTHSTLPPSPPSEPVVDLTNDSGMEDEDDDGPIDLTVQHSRVSRNIPQRLQLYNQDQQQRPSCRYARPPPPDSPDVVIVRVSDNEDTTFSTATTKQSEKPSAAGKSESSSNGGGEKKSNTSSLTCPICLESVEQFRRSGRQLVTTVCGHIFCNSCIRNSITRMHQCPNCRKKLTLKQYHALYI